MPRYDATVLRAILTEISFEDSIERIILLCEAQGIEIDAKQAVALKSFLLDSPLSLADSDYALTNFIYHQDWNTITQCNARYILGSRLQDLHRQVKSDDEKSICKMWYQTLLDWE